MRLKLLLFTLLLSGGILNAQDTIRSLVITEARINAQSDNYVEITNMGNDPVNMKDFEFGCIHPWSDPWNSYSPNFFRLPDQFLQPGESFMITLALDFGAEQYAKKTPGFEGDQQTKQKMQMYDLADMLIHMKEQKGDETDSVTIDPVYGEISWAFECWNGREAYYIEQHLSETDSVVVDQVSGVFDENGRNRSSGRYDVAGVVGATGTAILVRKYKVKQGNIDFANARGVGADDSEWIPWQWPAGWGKNRDALWTVGNHGDYKLDENTLESETADVDFAGKTITVPWGTRRGDGIMHLMKKKPGLAWIYELNPNYEDSLSFAAHTGDKLNLTVFGEEGYNATFDIVVAEPTADVKVVVPVSPLNYPASGTQWWRDDNQEGLLDWPRITEHTSGPDTITGTWYGIPYATAIDSLFKRLEKPSNAKWEIVPSNGIPSPDVKYGDKLKVTAQDGSVKEYFIEVQSIQPNHVAYLSAITWPDIPAEYRDLPPWVGDTIPGFNRTTTNYRITVPIDVDGIPALVAKTENLNATVVVKRATSLYGTTAERTISFEVTAEDDSVKLTYNVELIKEKNPANIQPYYADPFLSEYYFRDNWQNSFIEICNPGNQALDMSNYMVAWVENVNPSSVIESTMGQDEWLNRYNKYVPGYKWVNEAQWAITPGILEPDLSVNAIVYPGDVFCYGVIYRDDNTYQSWMGDYKWPVPGNLDVILNNFTNNSNKKWFPNGYTNPWKEDVAGTGSPWNNSSWYMFKILNDSITRGLKPANDPDDFELIETWSMSSSTQWIVGGVPAEQITNYMRKPEIYEGNTGFDTAGSFGTNLDDTEWTWTNTAYWQAKNVGWPYYYINEGNDIGQHFMYTPTQYISTVSSTAYKVSEGYSMNESIIGAKTGTTVAEFLGNVTKANEMQTLSVMRGDAELTTGDVLLPNDMLVVLSADSLNTTQYMLSVTDEGLSSNAVLMSDRYTVTVEIQPKSAGNENAGVGNITGFDYGTALRTILANITVPTGATMVVIDGEGAYVPLRTLNFDTTYVNVTVNDNIYLDVVAENGVTEIVYQLKPSSSDNDAFVLSDIYNVIQKDVLIEYVPRGTTVSTLLSNLVASAGATMKVVNKMGQERMDGGVADDDKVVVTSYNGQVTKSYYISKLASEATPSTTYLAYILSSTYPIDQVMYKVEGVSGSESVASFLANVTPVTGATAMVVDKDGMDKTTGDIDKDDMVKVTSADGKIMVYYTFGQLVTARTVNAENIQLYPNPTNGEINVSGVKAGYRIQVYNSVGSAVRDIHVQNSIEKISLGNQPAGMYMIVVSDNNKMLGRYKALKQ